MNIVDHVFIQKRMFEHTQGSIYDPPGASLDRIPELLDKLTEAYGYPVRIEIGNRHFTRLGVYKY